MNRLFPGASVLAAPLLIGLADQIRMTAEPPAELGGFDGDYGVESAAANLAAIQAHLGAFGTASWLLYAGLLLTIPALLAIWRLTAAGSRRWAVAAAALTGIGVLGLMGQFVAYYGVLQVLAQQPDLTAAATLDIALSSHPFAIGIFVPVLLGTLGAIAQAVALRRSRILPTWAAVSVVAATVLHVVLGSTPLTSAVWTALLVAGFAPVALALVREPSAVRTAPVPAR